ncbi:separase-like, partial [Trifolium medium]|nr:separase-like [Trifolium medium]
MLFNVRAPFLLRKIWWKNCALAKDMVLSTLEDNKFHEIFGILVSLAPSSKKKIEGSLLPTVSESEASKEFITMYFEALKFFCGPLSTSARLDMKPTLKERKSFCLLVETIGNAFHSLLLRLQMFLQFPAPILLADQWLKITSRKDTHYLNSQIFACLKEEISRHKKPMSNSDYTARERKVMTLFLLALEKCRPSQHAQGRIMPESRPKFYSTNGLSVCIPYFSNATIDLKKVISANMSVDVKHQLCVRHCLSVLCTLDANPCSKEIFKDVEDALDLWFGILPELSSNDNTAWCDDTLILLYNIIDLYHLK